MADGRTRDTLALGRHEATTQESSSVVLRVEGISKAFPGTQALRDVSLEVRRGEIHALLGGNGSGKSTLIQILAGVQSSDAGEVEINGQKFDARTMSPSIARDNDLHFVHQHVSTFADLSVAETLMASDHGFETGRFGRIRWGASYRHAERVLDRFNIDADPRQSLASLRPANQSMVAVARALQDQDDERDGILVLDEPTSALPPDEVRYLLAALRGYAKKGQAILLVTHRLDEVIEVADRATVLQDGRVAAYLTREELDHDRLFRLIAGEVVDRVARDESPSVGQIVLQAHDLAGGPVHDVNLSLRQGEIVGLAGLLGSGRSSLLRLIFGDLPLEGGSMTVDGLPFAPGSPRDAIRSHVVLVPEDRASTSAFADRSVVENLSAAVLPNYFRRGVLRHRAETHDARDLIRRYGIVCADESAAFSLLSGGNQQKTVIARWLQMEPRVILLDEPTEGVDVHARAEIFAILRQAVDDGATVLMATSDFEELATMCDRVLVMVAGRIVEELAADDTRLFEFSYSAGKESAPRVESGQQ